MQITFSEQEAKEHAEFINFVYTKANWNIPTADVMKLAVMFNKMHAFQKKIDDNIMELKEIIKKPAAKGKK